MAADKEFTLGTRVQEILMKAGYVCQAEDEKGKPKKGTMLFSWGRLEEDLLSGKYDPQESCDYRTAREIAKLVGLKIRKKNSKGCYLCNGKLRFCLECWDRGSKYQPRCIHK